MSIFVDMRVSRCRSENKFNRTPSLRARPLLGRKEGRGHPVILTSLENSSCP